MTQECTNAEYYAGICASSEAFIRSGRLTDARRIIAELKLKSVPREFASQLANLARRAGQPQRALEILWPYVRPDRYSSEPPTLEEIGEYAVALLRMGASQEAQKTLESVGEANSKLALYLGFAHMTQWSYESAIPCFQRYLSFDDVADYDRTLGMVNLAAAFVGIGDRPSAWPLLDEILATTSSHNWGLLHKNALGLCAQLAGQENDWDRAALYLDRTQEDETINKNDLLIHKWRAIGDLFRRGRSANTIDALSTVRREALEVGHSETVRDCDRYRALAERDRELYLRVYFGTPFSSYRKLLRKGAQGWVEIPKEFIWNIGRSPSERIFDLKSASETGGKVKLKPGQVLHRVLQIFVSDFYRPFLIGMLYARLFPDDYFNPETGPQRVHRILSRLRTWFEENEIPLAIGSSPAGFRLEATGDYAFRILDTGEEATVSDRAHYQHMIDRLFERWPSSKFSSSEVARLLSMSERSARDLLRWATDSRLIVRTGSGPATRYSFFHRGGDQ